MPSADVFPRKSHCPLEESIRRLSEKLKLRRMGFESDGISFNFHRRLKKSNTGRQLIPQTCIIEKIRSIKSAAEIELLRQAAKLALASFKYAQKIIRPGQKESAVADELQYFMRQQGAEDSAFDPIVASGIRSSLPHAPISSKIIRNNQPVLVDLGCRLSGYNSDLTRMVFLGKIGGKLKRIYQAVRQAQQLAISVVKAGVEASQVDLTARNYLRKEKLAPFFVHALGHGIGRDIHEAPSISSQNKSVLAPGMVFTVEPGIYLPGWGGVRVEDMVLVKKNGAEVLTK
ncbi:M24 family metallopeptidase [Candidatus Omnitrophota bacterium]